MSDVVGGEADDLAALVNEGRKARLRLSLVAEQCPDLLPLLDATRGAVVGGAYRIGGLLASGRQFFVWLGAEPDTGRAVVLKQARFDYRHPVRYGRAEAEHLRRAIRKEYEVLLADRTGTLPRPLALLVTDSPVPAASLAPALARNEVFVAEEFIRGPTLTELALRVWPDHPPAEREATASRLGAAFVGFWESLRDNGWHYGDLSSDNLLVESDTGRLRVVDGGSAVPAAEAVVLSGFTPAFTTPRLFAAASAGQPVAGSVASVLPLLGKVLYFTLTRREPLNGLLPDLADPALEVYSPMCRLVLELLLDLDGRPERLHEARQALARWAGLTT
jgi:serine/threonine protein kinase